MNGKIFFSDNTILDYRDTTITYLDNGILQVAREGKIFIPYGSIKMISEE